MKPLTSRRALWVLAGLCAVGVGFSASCGTSGSNSQAVGERPNDAAASSSGGESGSGGGSGSGGSSASSSSSGGSGDGSGSSSGGEEGGCTPGAQQCSGSSVEACNADGQWGSPWPCTTGTCSHGACTGSTTAGTSCHTNGDGLTNCGASQESCCTSLEVTGGSYSRTYDFYNYVDGAVDLAADGGPGGEADPARVSGFRLDKYEVTVGRFRQFVGAVLPPDGGPGWTPAAGSGKHAHLNGGMGLSVPGGGYEPGWVASDDASVAPTDANLACQPRDDTWTPAAGTQETLPINCVTWYEAYAFCIWDGGFLPSEAEWEYAAAGGSQQREYPWGSTDPGTNSQYAVYDGYYPNGAVPDAAPGTPGSPMGLFVTDMAPVGTATLGATLYGQLDLAGNVQEWNLDGSESSYANPCADCANFTGGSGRAVRGGNFGGAASFLLASFRVSDAPSTRIFYYGFRCARAP